ncbi:MAG TPA: hypothetical protein DCS24_09450 [Erythrobacter sp.]|nr:hypothetical protein [Erythrobacter sp.]
MAVAGLAMLGLGFALVWAQIEGNRGIPPVASSADIDVTGIEVDVRGSSGKEARERAWRQAQRIAWRRLNGPALPDEEIESLVAAVVIEEEQIGPRRYIAKLGVIFDRVRAGSYIGGEQATRVTQSAPMLVIPVTSSAGSQLVYEMRNPWQRAWAEFQPGQSPINYLRPAGFGGDSLLLTYGQTGRRSRLWWRVILDQFGAADVLVPVATLHYDWPGGPIRGEFTARYGPDSDYLDSFVMDAQNPSELPDMLDRAVGRFDEIFTRALAQGRLRPDPTLDIVAAPEVDPALEQLIAVGRAIEEREAAIAAGEIVPGPVATMPPQGAAPVQSAITSYPVQFETPDARSVDATLASVRAAAGVRGATTSSLAIGGTSIMMVSYAGSIGQLAAALRAQGFNVRQGSNALAISR